MPTSYSPGGSWKNNSNPDIWFSHKIPKWSLTAESSAWLQGIEWDPDTAQPVRLSCRCVLLIIYLFLCRKSKTLRLFLHVVLQLYMEVLYESFFWIPVKLQYKSIQGMSCLRVVSVHKHVSLSSMCKHIWFGVVSETNNLFIKPNNYIENPSEVWQECVFCLIV